MTDTAASDATPRPEVGPDPGPSSADTVPGDGTDRVEQFRSDVAAMKVREPAAARDRLLLWLGVVGMVAGIGLGVGAMFLSMDADGPLQQRDAMVQGIFGLTLAVVGAALYVRAALAGFLRFWMARVSYELHAGPDR